MNTTSVSVFLAFQAKRTVTVTVTQRGGPAGAVATSPPTDTVALGARLHVVVVTANTGGAPLSAGHVYDYDVSWTATAADAFSAVANLQDAGLRTAATGVVYADGALPSFSLPPADIAKVRLMHGSCRKAHSEGIDMLGTLDTVIAADVGNADQRPHQLFLTGDQIYADDVADSLLSALTAAGDVLLGWSELLPGVNKHPSDPDLGPGKRDTVMTRVGGTGAGVTTDKGIARSHLLGLGEFYAMYLLSFSAAVWPATLPTFADAFPTESAAYEAAQVKLQEWIHAGDGRDPNPPYVPFAEEKAAYETQEATVAGFRDQLKAVRRALANVPTYTICDDHEVTDDWYMNRTWCSRVLGQPLGRRLVRNALLGYAIFQAWGSTPGRFAAGQPGGTLLTTAASAVAPGGFPAAADAQFDQLLSIPASGADPSPGLGMTHPAGAIDWHYKVAVAGAPYEVLVFDSRTWRAFPAGAMDNPELIGAPGFAAHRATFGAQAAGTQVTIAVVPGPIFDLPFMSDLKRGFIAAREGNFVMDFEAWDGQPIAQQRLLSYLFGRSANLVALAGDVHFSYTARIGMWAGSLFEQPGVARTGVMAQFTCSPLSNEDHGLTGSYKFTTGGFNRATVGHGTVPDHLDMAGWNTVHGEIQIGTHKEGFAFWADYKPWRMTQAPVILRVNDIPLDSHMVAEDFRYRVDYLEIDTPLAARTALTGTKAVPPGATADGLKNAQTLLRKGGGQQVVGANAIGRIRFTKAANGPLSAIQELWWRVPGVADPQIFSAWTVSLDPAAAGFQQPGKLPGVP